MAHTIQSGDAAYIKNNERLYERAKNTGTGVSFIAPARYGTALRLHQAATFIGATGKKVEFGTAAIAMATIKIVSVPTDNSKIVIDGVTTTAKNFIFKAGGGSDSDPDYYLDTTALPSVIALAPALITKINAVSAMAVFSAPVDLSTATIYVVDTLIGATTIAAKSGGDSSTSLTVTSVSGGVSAQTIFFTEYNAAIATNSPKLWSPCGWIETAVNEALTAEADSSTNQYVAAYSRFPA